MGALAIVPVIIAGGWVGGKAIMTCNKDTTDLDCLDCPYGYDDDEAVYCLMRGEGDCLTT